MSERVGLMTVLPPPGEESPYGNPTGASEQTMQIVDEEVRRIVTECYEATRTLLEDHRSEVEAIAEALLKYEVLSGEEVAAVLEGDSVDALRRKAEAESQAAKSAAEQERAAAEADDPDDVDDLETKGHFAY